MENTGMVQARTSLKTKSEAMDILDKLGLSMSTYINMALSQLIIKGGIPFESTIYASPYTLDQKIANVIATMRMEGMEVTSKDIERMKSIHS